MRVAQPGRGGRISGPPGQVKALRNIPGQSDLTSSLTSSTIVGEKAGVARDREPGGMLSGSGGGGGAKGSLWIARVTEQAPHAGFFFFPPSSDPILPRGRHFFFLVLSFLELLRRSESREVGRGFFFSHMSPQNYSSQTIQ